MSKYLLLKHYRGALDAVNDVPMDKWTPQRSMTTCSSWPTSLPGLGGTGEYVDGLGPAAGLAALATVDPGLPLHTAASAYLHEKSGDLRTAARLYADAARSAPNLAERHHLTRQAARIGQALRG